MPSDYLDFEEPIGALENKIQELQSSGQTQGEDLKKEISKLNESIIKLTEQIYKNLNVWPVSYTHLTLPTILLV